MKNRTLFQNAVLIMLPIILAASLLMLMLGYKNVKSDTYKHYEEDIGKAAAAAVSTAEDYDLNKPEDARKCSQELSQLCNDLDVPYLYVLEIDETARSEKYLAMGFHGDVPQELVEARHIGDVVTGYVTQQQIDAFHGKQEGNIIHEINEFGDTLLCYMPIGDTGLIVGSETSISAIVAAMKQEYTVIVLITVALTVSITLAFALILHMTVSIPAKEVSSRMAGFVSERAGDCKMPENYSSKEFTEMAKSFNSMADEIQRYLDDIDSLNKEKHTREAELDIAKNIQNGLLPPDEHIGKTAEIHAFIAAAKEVGGDLYDYYEHENGDVSVAIADVSGKGVSAALFMSGAITLLRTTRKMELSPAETLETFNDALAAYNPHGLFITAFIARWSPATGKLTYSNAGHNPPYVVSDRLITLDGAHGMAAGIFAGVPYEEAEITLSPGDLLFLFTDGVNEAQNENGDLLGTETLENILSDFAGKDKRNVIPTVLGRISSFAGEAQQSDDITILTLIPSADKPTEYDLEVSAEPANLLKINDLIDSVPGLTDETVYQLKLAAEEVFVNICSYAYEDGKGNVGFSLIVSDKAEMIFSDSGTPFDPTKDVPDIGEYDHSTAVGGLGRFIAFQLAEKYSYRRENGRNILALSFKR